MTPANLQNALIKRIRSAIATLSLSQSYLSEDSESEDAPNVTESGFKVYKQNVPEQAYDDYEDEETFRNRIYPFVNVKIDTASQAANHEPHVIKLLLIIGVKNENVNNVGFDDALACTEKIINDLNSNPIVDDRYLLQYPIDWSPHDENTFPYFFIGVGLTFALETPQSNFQGGYLNGY